MKIKRNFWNYGIMNWYGIDTPNNLCQYVRKLSLAYFLTGLFGFIFTWITTSFLWLIGARLGFWFDFFFLENQTFFQSLITLGVDMGLILSILLSIIYAIDIYREKRRIKRYLEGYEPKEKGIIRQWLSDQHDKICRPVEFEK